jgi:mono/diheme cytochrome c family protein
MPSGFVRKLGVTAIFVASWGGGFSRGSSDGPALFTLQAQAASSVRDGVYSADQAKRDEALYATNCASCHGAKLEGHDQAPPLAGGEFVMNWDGQPLSELLEKIQTSMPADKPGSLSAKENTDVIAFLLRANGLPGGVSELPSEAERLKQIRFEAAEQ